MPATTQNETSDQTVALCLRLFEALGVEDVSLNNIDIAHRIPSRSASSRPNAIFCKFTRRLAKGKVMAVRRKLENLEASQLGFPDDFDISHINLYDHLTPRRQELLFESKKYKNANNSNSVGRKTRGTQRQVSENICSEDDLRSKIFGTFVVRFLASCLS